MNVQKQTVTIFLFLILFFSGFFIIHGSHNTNRYFPLIERPEIFLERSKGGLTGSIFATTAASAFQRSSGKVGIPGLWGPYDLKDLIDSLEAERLARGFGFTNPFAETLGVEGLENRKILFDVDGKISSAALQIEGYHQFFSPDFFLGFSLPFMSVSARSKYLLRTQSTEKIAIDPIVENLNQGEKNLVERVRLSVHDSLGIEPFDWEKVGFGDLDLHLRYTHQWDHALLMKSITTSVWGGVIFPMSVMSDIDNPASAPFMGNGHVGFYTDVLSEFELKTDMKIGGWLSFMFQAPSTRTRRISYFSEPDIFSALKGRVKVTPGYTFKFSPYVTLENLVDGLHAQVRYTYLRQSEHTTRDKRKVKTPVSYLEKTPSEDHTLQSISQNREAKKKLSSWRGHYISIQLMYEPKEALKDWVFDPVFYIMIDTPYSGRGISKTHQISAGATLRF